MDDSRDTPQDDDDAAAGDTADAVAARHLLARQAPSWQAALGDELCLPYFHELARFVAKERKAHAVFPPEHLVWNAFAQTPFERVRVLLLGQDPYHDDGQAHGLCFSVPPGVKPPPSLANIYKELAADLSAAPPPHGDLTHWARQGVLLLNTVLTVRAHEAHSHKGHGWEQFTDAVIRKLSEREEPVVFVLWGGPAKKKARLIDGERHAILTGTHPSPLSAHQGFFGSRPFSAINAALRKNGQPEIAWSRAPVS